MKKRILAMALALMMLVMIPAETVMAMPAAFDGDAAVVTLTEEGEEVVVEDESTPEETEETEEVVEEPTAEPEVTEEPVVEEPTAEPEVTEEPVVEEPTAEPEVTEEPVVEEPTAEPEVTEEPTEEATEETTVEPEVTEEPTEEATEEPTETPEVTMPEKQDVMFEGRDLTAKVVGSDGVQYDNVEYLSLQAVNSMASEGVDEYIKLCDEVAALQKNTDGASSAIFAIDANGDLNYQITIPTNLLFSEEIRGQFVEDIEEEPAIEEPAEETTGEEIVEESVVEEATEEVTEPEVAEEATEEPAEEIVEIPEGIEEPAAETEAIRAVVVEENAASDIVVENMDLLQANALPVEDVDVVEDAEYDTKMSNANYFKNQLDSTEKAIYGVAYKAIVKGGKNSFTYNNYMSNWSMVDALSALNLTYPNSFNWMHSGGATSMRGTYSWSSHSYKYTVTIEKSKYYKSSLEKKAKAKVNELVKEAKASAVADYPGNQVYGMVRYFDTWIREHNYYNDEGTSSGDSASKVYYYCHSCYGVLLEGYGVCESYALAMTRLLDAAGIRNAYVTGYAGGGHAWNYVQMPNGKWYMLDTTWNDNDYAADDRFLAGSKTDNGVHRAQGAMYTIGSYFTFPTLDTSDYASNTEKNYLNQVTLNKTSFGLTPGKTYKLKAKKPSSGSNYYYSKYKTSWSSSNTKVAKVSKSGKVTAVAPGKATITYSVAGLKKTSTVYVYQFTGNKFTDNNKTSLSYTYLSADTKFDGSDMFKKNITVNQKNRTYSATQLQSYVGLKAPTVKTSNSKVATATATLSNDTIVLTVTPKKIGTATITVSFGGKTSTLKLTNRYNIATNTGWFDYSKIVNKTYKGAAYKPAVKKTATAPKNLKYSVSYKNNTNAGTATVTIKGSGNYGGTITKNFIISPKNLSECKFSSSTKSKTYNGKAQKASTTVKDGKKTLKAGATKDYEVQYYYNRTWTATAPTNVGTYSVRIVGKNNYTGTVAAPNTYEIKQIKLSKVTISCAKEVKWKKGNPVTAPVKVKIGKNTLTAGVDYNISYYKVDSKGNKVGSAIAPTALCDKGNYKAFIVPKGNNINWGTKSEVVKAFKIKKMS